MPNYAGNDVIYNLRGLSTTISSGYICLEAYLARWSRLVACDLYSAARLVGEIEYISVISPAKLRYKTG